MNAAASTLASLTGAASLDGSTAVQTSPLALSADQVVTACDELTGSTFARDLLTGFAMAGALALVEKGFEQVGELSEMSEVAIPQQAMLVCAVQLADPHSGSILTLATGLVIDKEPSTFGVMRLRWDVLRELQKDRPDGKVGRKLGMKIAYEVPQIAPQALTEDASQLLAHLKNFRRTVVAKLVRTRAEELARELVEALAP